MEASQVERSNLRSFLFGGFARGGREKTMPSLLFLSLSSPRD
jgi:hypothetical protein